MKKLLFVVLAIFLSVGMAFAASPVYVWDGSAQDDGDATWNSATIAYLTLTLALAAVDVNGIIYVASEHVEAGGSYTWGSANGNIKVISVNKDDSDAYLPMISDGAPGSLTTGAGGDIIVNGSDTYIGLTIISDDNFTINTGDTLNYFIDCKITVNDLMVIGAGNDDMYLYWENVTYYQTSPYYISLLGAHFHWRGGVYGFGGTGAATTQAIELNVAASGVLILEDIDFQDLDAGDVLIGGTNTAIVPVIKRCKIPAALSGISSTITGPGLAFKAHSVSNADVIYHVEEKSYTGTVTHSNTVYLDATYDGTNGYGVSMVSSANAIEWVRPLRYKLADIWVSATGKTLTVELLTDNITLDKDEFWIEVEYPDSTTGALGNILLTREPLITSTSDDLTASAKGAGDWTGESGTPVYQKTTADFTGVADEAVGVYTVWACLAKPSTTVYVDPKITVN